MDKLHTDVYLSLVNNEFDKFVLAFEKNSQLSIYLSICAARHPDHRYLTFLYENGCPWDELTFSNAIQHGDLSFIKWLREKGCPFNEIACSEASKHGKLDILQWLRKEGCPWDWTTGFYAAKSGYLHILEWIYENGCPYKDDVIGGAIYSRNLSVLRWFHEKNLLTNPLIAYCTTVLTDEVAMMEWLSTYCPLSSPHLFFNRALSHHSLSVLIWFIRKKFSSNNRAACKRARYLGIKYNIPFLFVWGKKKSVVLTLKEEEFDKNYTNIYTHLYRYLIPDLVGVVRQYY